MSKRAKVWARFMAAAIPVYVTLEHASNIADEALAEYDKRFPQPTKELTQENVGRRIAWWLGENMFQGTIVEEKKSVFAVTPDYDTDAVTYVAKGPGVAYGSKYIDENPGISFREEALYGLDALNIKPSHNPEWNEYIQQHIQPNEPEADTHATT